MIGGGTRTEQLTLPGFLHDVCSAIHPMGMASPFFTDLGIDVEWIQPDLPLSHPLGGGRAGTVWRDVKHTATGFGVDGDRYLRIMQPLIDRADDVIETSWARCRRSPRTPRVSSGLPPGGAPCVVSCFRILHSGARGVLAGLAGHAIAPFGSPRPEGLLSFSGSLPTPTAGPWFWGLAADRRRPGQGGHRRWRRRRDRSRGHLAR